MNALALFLYGAIAISSAIMVVAWGKAAKDVAEDVPPGELKWCKAYVIAAALTLHAVAMTGACGYRVYDLLFNGLAEVGTQAWVLIVLLLMLSGSKLGFVWASAISEDERRARWPWWAYLYCLTLWGTFCLVWMGLVR